MSRLVLVGMPGVGKTTIGRAVANRLGCGFLDLDEMLADTIGVSAADFLRENGEEAFRIAESSALRVALQSDAVVSCGGGTVTYGPSRNLLHNHHCVIWLTAPLGVLEKRVHGGDRPLLGDDATTALAGLYDVRGPLYREVATTQVDTDRDLDDVVREIVEYVGKLSA